MMSVRWLGRRRMCTMFLRIKWGEEEEEEEEEKSLKEMVVEMRRKNEELEGEKRELEGKKRELQSQLRVWEGKYKELDQRVLQLERDTSMLKDEGQCVLGNGEGESVVQREPDGLVNGVGDRGSTQRGSDSKGGGGSVSLGCNARRKVDFGTGSCLSPLAGSNSKSPVIKDGVLGALPGDGSTPIVEIIESDDDGGGPSEKLAGDIYRGRRNDEKGNKELKRKRGSFSSVFEEPLTQTLRGIATALKQCGQKNIKEKDSDNSFIKLAGVNTIKHENGDGSASAKSDDGSSLQNERWKYKANMLDDITEDDELCIKAVCALHRWQMSKLMERSTRQGFDGLLSPKEKALAEFLTGGDPEGKLKKSVMDLRDHSPEGLAACRNIVTKHFEQLFIMYQKKGDPFFPSS
ncbi:uncharacterized protein LOC104446097 [Eucalyptus grandis]|uniref:uncharacterized protein LOC104446097 n=1 Tax=Eucalyptus grandis TaxID=71139 RepID=UPI00192EF67C|nr:uncharacterized protein LOC104446097 [Eucalyptus grandis]